MDVEIRHKRLVSLPKSAAAEDARPEGAALAKDIVNRQLRAIHDGLRSSRTIDGEEVKTLRDLAAVYDLLAARESKERAADALSERLANMSDAELDELERELRGKKR